MREKSVENQIKAYVYSEGGIAIKLFAGVEQGKNTLDLIGGVYGRPFWVEVKKPNGVASVVQLELVKRFKAQGFISGVVESLDEFKELFKRETNG